MVIGDLYLVCVALAPHKADSPLLVDSNAMLASPIPGKLLQSICRRDTKIVEVRGVVQHPQFPQCHLLNISGKFSGTLPSKYLLRFLVSE